MRPAASAGAFLGALLFLTSACDGDVPTGAASPPGSVALSTSGTCGPATRPGSIVGRVDTPAPWGVAVRDDGLAFFTALFENSVPPTASRCTPTAGCST